MLQEKSYRLNQLKLPQGFRTGFVGYKQMPVPALLLLTIIGTTGSLAQTQVLAHMHPVRLLLITSPAFALFPASEAGAMLVPETKNSKW